MSEQSLPEPSQSPPALGGLPVQLPVVDVSVWPSTAEPLMAGSAVFVGQSP